MITKLVIPENSGNVTTNSPVHESMDNLCLEGFSNQEIPNLEEDLYLSSEDEEVKKAYTQLTMYIQ